MKNFGQTNIKYHFQLNQTLIFILTIHYIVYHIYRNLLTLITVSTVYFGKHQTTAFPTQQAASWSMKAYENVIKYRHKGSCDWGLRCWLWKLSAIKLQMRNKKACRNNITLERAEAEETGELPIMTDIIIRVYHRHHHGNAGFFV